MHELYAKCRCQFQAQLVTTLSIEEFDSFQERREEKSAKQLPVILYRKYFVTLVECSI